VNSVTSPVVQLSYRDGRFVAFIISMAPEFGM